ncbi:MAG: hypothetical protein WCJ49_05330, partial [Deltaproteobacteria bacterium]
EIQLVINSAVGKVSSKDSYYIRRGALANNIPYTTTLSAAKAVTEAISELLKGPWDVTPLQEYHAQIKKEQ